MSKVQANSKFLSLGIKIDIKLLITFIPSLLFLIVGITTGYSFGVTPSLLLGDLADIAGKINPLYGLFTNIGVLCWIATATVCLFTAITLRKLKSKKIFNFLMYSGILSAYLGIDDAFMLHDFVAPIYLKISENFILASILIAFIVYIVRFYKLILASNYTFFILALSFLTMSLGLDVCLKFFEETARIDVNVGLPLILEDGSKFLGITSWLSYFIYYCYDLLMSILGKDTH